MTRRDFLKWCIRGLVGFVFLDGLWLEKEWIDVQTFTVKASPQASTSVRCLQISDVHIQQVTPTLKRIAHEVHQKKLDIIVFTGDSVDGPDKLSVFEESLKLFPIEVPKLAILGNWEYWGNIDLIALAEIYRRYNGELLVNQCWSRSIKGKTILISGLDDLISGAPDMHNAMKSFVPNDFHLVLNHCPEYRDVLVNHAQELPKMDLVLSGHTHGGQINVFGYVPVVPRGSGRYLKGWYKDNEPPMYVARGVGTSSVPIRFGSQAEITYFEFLV